MKIATWLLGKAQEGIDDERTPVVAGPLVEDFDEDEYRRLAGSVGFHPGAAISERKREQEKRRFREFLSESGICVYPEGRVNDYMNAAALKLAHAAGRESWTATWRWINISIYEEAIPAPVLMTAAKIRAVFPNTNFEITEIKLAPKGDPFMSVMHAGVRYIVERWDEPGFRM